MASSNSHSISKQEAKEDRPNVYEYYTEGGINSGLEALPDGFKLNGKDIRIFSGAMHYFRVHPALWRDRMRKMRAAGLNTLETYVPWNLHEPRIGFFDFGDKDEDFSLFLDVRSYVQIAQEEDLLVIFRPGPYICSEWDFGGLPSWLLRDPEMKVRSSYRPFLDRTEAFFNALLPLVEDLQFTKGGPIISFQIENEYGGFGLEDRNYMNFIKSNFESNGLIELYFTSDSPLLHGDKGALPGILQTANFNTNAEAQINALLELQPDKPVLVAEFWPGWFDHWLEYYHNILTAERMEHLMNIIFKFNGSINFYMFHGGTNFGFMAGANNLPLPYPEITSGTYLPDVTSYDYNAPLSESGDYEPKKFFKVREMIAALNLPYSIPEIPVLKPKKTYSTIQMQSFLNWDDLIERIPETSKFLFDKPVSMELLPMNEESGQSYGYIVYRINVVVANGSILRIGRVRDLLTVLIDGKLQSKPLSSVAQLATGFGYWNKKNQELVLELPNEGRRTIDLIVENMGRVNFGGPKDFIFQKGLHEGKIFIDDVEIKEIETFALEFKNKWTENLQGFKPITDQNMVFEGPTLFHTEFNIDEEEPSDTFIQTGNWNRGIVFVNGFNIGRYHRVGPQKTLYVPGPFLKTGLNTIRIFEMWTPSNELIFTDKPNLGPERLLYPFQEFSDFSYVETV